MDQRLIVYHRALFFFKSFRFSVETSSSSSVSSALFTNSRFRRYHVKSVTNCPSSLFRGLKGFQRADASRYIPGEDRAEHLAEDFGINSSENLKDFIVRQLLPEVEGDALVQKA